MQANSPDHPIDGVLGLFEGFGIELEYMIVDADTLDVSPVADRLMEAVAGELTDEHENGTVAWNNELALHVIEFKCNGPSPSLDGLADAFQENVALANSILRDHGRQLMPTAMHPWMDPQRELVLWPHGSSRVYETFDRIFGCAGHGWANLQSAHLNLPFRDDDEFARLSAAIRFLLPVLPGLAASSPVIDGALNGNLDNRLLVYRENCARIPSVTGVVIPEPVYSMEEYRTDLLQRIYDDVAPHDPERVLRYEWVNARGAIARFDRMAIEIRLLDVQECPEGDLAFTRVIVETLRSLCEETWTDLATLRAWDTEELARLLQRTARSAERTEIRDRRYLAALGLAGREADAAALWSHLIDHAVTRIGCDSGAARWLENYVRHGSLATRIVDALGGAAGRDALRDVYRRLCAALAAGEPFRASS